MISLSSMRVRGMNDFRYMYKWFYSPLEALGCSMGGTRSTYVTQNAVAICMS